MPYTCLTDSRPHILDKRYEEIGPLEIETLSARDRPIHSCECGSHPDSERNIGTTDTPDTKPIFSSGPVLNVDSSEWYESEDDSGSDSIGGLLLDSLQEDSPQKEGYEHLDTEERRKSRCIPFPNNISWILDNGKVPNLLFGYYVLDIEFKELLDSEVRELLEEEPSPQGADFVIPDKSMDKAIDTLQKYRSNLCRNEKCKYFTPACRQYTASVHFDKDPTGRYGPIALYRKSQMLWRMKDWTVERPALTDTQITLSSWFNLPWWQGCSSASSSANLDRYPVKILELNALTEALMYLYCRDYRDSNGRQHWWEPMLLVLADLPGEQKDFEGARSSRVVTKFCQPYWDDFVFFPPRRDSTWEDDYLSEDDCLSEDECCSEEECLSEDECPSEHGYSLEDVGPLEDDGPLEDCPAKKEPPRTKRDEPNFDVLAHLHLDLMEMGWLASKPV